MQMLGLDDKMREEKRNIGMQSKEKIGWDAVETMPILLHGYTDNFTLLSVYIRGIKSSGMLGMVSVKTTPSVCINKDWGLDFNVCIYKWYIVKWIADDGVL